MSTADPATALSGSGFGQPRLAESLAHLRTRGDGTHELTIALHPAELGSVQVHAMLHDGTLTVTVACADAAARAAVKDALPQLDAQLGGLGSIDVQLGSSHGAPHQGTAPQAQDTAPRPAAQRGNDDDAGSSPRRQAPRQQRQGGVDQWM